MADLLDRSCQKRYIKSWVKKCYIKSWLIQPARPRAESARAVTGRRNSYRWEGGRLFEPSAGFFYGNSCNSGTESRKIVPKVGNWPSCRGLKMGHWPKLRSYGKNQIFGPKTEILGPKKKVPLFYSNHVLATAGKSCSKKKSAFAQIIKGENVILGDFLG